MLNGFRDQTRSDYKSLNSAIQNIRQHKNAILLSENVMLHCFVHFMPADVLNIRQNETWKI